MNLIFRLLAVVVAAVAATLRGKRIDLLGASALRFRVWPTDLDINMHMTNARYFSVMDLGRTDLMIRAGLGPVILNKRWQPVLGGATVRYRRPLRPFQRFTLVSRVLCWDEKYIFIEHRMESRKGLAALAVVQGAFVGRSGVVPPAEVLAAIGSDAASPPFPDAAAALRGQGLSTA
ncbi:thioesterase family protein [Azospirillum picis]|uniref:Acyl-CoA thioesterase FadM n=1 Tax=Azospirillum picis TaxID=488438 RepID=A0ABU0MV39_9PROT|nr:thioesterase family protein [Azospirillum picis]MBP2303481.1 acyl-CoA thioesterase FadM [Azospirillum picis]MDQ0537330.1 acyl-CoA thioesterase FadM [Azospirillum picis]